MNNMSKITQKQYSHGLKTACFTILSIIQDSFLPSTIKMTSITILDKSILWESHLVLLNLLFLKKQNTVHVET